MYKKRAIRDDGYKLSVLIEVVAMAASHYENSDLVQDFKPGDLLYGLNDKREPYTRVLRQKFADKRPNLRLTADEFNNSVIFKLIDFSGGYSGDASQTLPFSSPASLDYHKYLLSSALPGLRLTDALSDEKKRPDDLDGEDRRLRRGCKAMIQYIQTPGYQVANALGEKATPKVHFILDGLLDLETVFQDERPSPTKGGVGYFYTHTAAELRYIKRHWPCGVVFYKRGERQKSNYVPWEDEAFRRYDFESADADIQTDAGIDAFVFALSTPQKATFRAASSSPTFAYSTVASSSQPAQRKRAPVARFALTYQSEPSDVDLLFFEETKTDDDETSSAFSDSETDDDETPLAFGPTPA